MPTKIRDSKSGGLIFSQTPDEKTQMSLVKENRMLKLELIKLSNKMKELDDLKRIVKLLEEKLNATNT